MTDTATTDDALPAAAELAHADTLTLRDQSGGTTLFSSLRHPPQGQGRGQPKAVLLVLTRHFHCGMCMEYVRALAQSHLLTQNPNITTIIVGPGLHQALPRYIQQTGNPPFQFYADPDLALYKALRVTRRSLDMGDPAKGHVPSHHTKTSSTVLKSVVETISSGSLISKGGDFKQLGAEFLFDTHGNPVFAHRMRHTRDHSEVLAIEHAIQKACLLPPPPPPAAAAASTSFAPRDTLPATATSTSTSTSTSPAPALPPTTTSAPGVAGSNLLPGKVVAITGASRGIGRAIALACAAHGARGILVHYLGDAATTSEAQSLQDELAALGATSHLVPGDISDAAVGQSISDAAQTHYGRLDVFVSNAGICPFQGFLDMPHQTWKRTQDVNLNGAFYAIQAAARLMSSQPNPGGSIVAVSSISALVGGAMQR